MSKPRDPNKYYFTPQTNLDIDRYNETTDPIDKNRVWEDKLQIPLAKLCECTWHLHGHQNLKLLNLHSAEEWIKIGLTRCFEVLPRLVKGKNYYAYLGTVLKNLYFATSIDYTKYLTRHDSIDSMDGSGDLNLETGEMSGNLPIELHFYDQKTEDFHGYCIAFADYLELNQAQFCHYHSETARSYLKSLIYAFRHAEDIEFEPVEFRAKDQKTGVRSANKFLREHGYRNRGYSAPQMLAHRLAATHKIKYQEWLTLGRLSDD